VGAKNATDSAIEAAPEAREAEELPLSKAPCGRTRDTSAAGVATARISSTAEMSARDIFVV